MYDWHRNNKLHRLRLLEEEKNKDHKGGHEPIMLISNLLQKPELVKL
jgi:hypothetical protein